MEKWCTCKAKCSRGTFFWHAAARTFFGSRHGVRETWNKAENWVHAYGMCSKSTISICTKYAQNSFLSQLLLTSRCQDDF